MTLVNTLVQPMRSKYKKNTLDKLEHRGSRYGAYDFYRDQTSVDNGILTPETQAKAKLTMGTSLQLPVLNYEDVTIGNARTCTITPSENTSVFLGLTWVTYSFGFTMQPAALRNNEITYEQDFQKKLEKYLQKLAATLDTAAINSLEANKNTYWPTSLTSMYYPVVGNTMQITQAQKTDFFNKYQDITETMDLYGDTHVVGSTNLASYVRRLAADGDSNAVNNKFQLDPFMTHRSNRIIPAAGEEISMYLVKNGMVATMNRNDPDSVAGSRIHEGDYWGEVAMPIVNLTMGSRYVRNCADISGLQVSGTSHLTASMQEGFMFNTDVCFVTAYNSQPGARYDGIVKAAIQST